ncbi:MAG: hypothetical protein ACO1O4_06775 [Devosia sp.]
MTFTVDDLRALPEHLAAFLAGTSLAINDMQMLRRSQLLAMNAVGYTKKRSSPELLALLQSLTEDRLLSARLFEYAKFYSKFAAEYPFDGEAQRVVTSALGRLVPLRDLPGYQIAKWMRNKITNHIDIEEAVRAVRQSADGDSFSVLLHETQWNTWHPLGDQMLSYYGLKKFGDQAQSLADWHHWIDGAHEWALETHNEFIVALLEQYFPEKMAIEKREIVDERLIGTPATATVPLFYVDDDGMDR